MIPDRVPSSSSASAARRSAGFLLVRLPAGVDARLGVIGLAFASWPRWLLAAWRPPCNARGQNEVPHGDDAAAIAACGGQPSRAGTQRRHRSGCTRPPALLSMGFILDRAGFRRRRRIDLRADRAVALGDGTRAWAAPRLGRTATTNQDLRDRMRLPAAACRCSVRSVSEGDQLTASRRVMLTADSDVAPCAVRGTSAAPFITSFGFIFAARRKPRPARESHRSCVIRCARQSSCPACGPRRKRPGRTRTNSHTSRRTSRTSRVQWHGRGERIRQVMAQLVGPPRSRRFGRDIVLKDNHLEAPHERLSASRSFSVCSATTRRTASSSTETTRTTAAPPQCRCTS
jgi:hypothetical protein